MMNIVRLVCLLILPLIVLGQNGLENCEQLLEMPHRNAHVHCNCMQKLVDMSSPLYKLTINQTGCEDRLLVLDWSVLQTYVGVKTLVFDNAMIKFSEERSMKINCSVTEVIFVNSKLQDGIHRNAFHGLHLLERVRFINTEIGNIKSKAFSGFPNLRTVEFSDASIEKIESMAFSNLINLFEIGFIRTPIRHIESSALQLSRPIFGVACPRSHSPSMNEVMSRDLLRTGNLTLPDYGPRIFIYKSTINTIESRGIEADLFSYLIFAGNTVEHLQSRAFKGELQNKCDISALLMIGNNVRHLGSEVFAGITGSKQGNNMATYIEISKNKFEIISPRAFSINETLKVFSVEDNVLGCTCDNFHWLLSNQESEAQKDLERQLVEESFCLDGLALKDYLLTYKEKCPPPSMEEPAPPRTTIREIELSTESILTSGSVRWIPVNYFIGLQIVAVLTFKHVYSSI